uniref:Putative lipocalin-3 1 n=1 Tax=Amblyomma cajennense TaxID=34607 RepID=A0A023FQN3_AMBCJ
MAQLWILQALVFTLFVVAALSDRNGNQDSDFTEFLKKGKTIWVFNTTEPGEVTCRRDTILNIEDSSVSFTRQFKNNTEISVENLEGKLFNWEHWESKERKPYDSMTISKSKGNGIEEFLEFVDTTGDCAVVKVMNIVDFNTDPSRIWRELRVTNPLEGIDPTSECWKTFDNAVNITGKNWRESYNKDCQ